MKIAAAYIRVSTDDQLEYSPESQIKAIREYAKAHELILSNEFIFQDDGKSGRNVKNRPEFNRMIAQAKSNPAPFNVILVWKFSRFARNQEESIFYKSMLKRNNIDVISISESVVDGPFGDLIERIIEWFDEYYSIRLSGEVKRGMTEKVSRGEAVSVPPFGYKLENKELIIVPEEAKVVKMIFDLFTSGVGYAEISRRINNMGIKSHRGNKFETRTISYILNNPVYLGKIRWNPTGRTRRNFKCKDIMIVDGHHEPIIDQETWDKAQSIIKQFQEKHKRYEKPFKFNNMLQGIVRCSTCGATLIKNGQYMQCCNYTKTLCTVSHGISYTAALEAVISGIEEDFRTGNIQLSQNTSNVNTAEIDIINAQIQREEQKFERIKQAYEDGIDSIEEYKANKQRIIDSISKLRDQLPKDETPKQSEIIKKLQDRYADVIVRLRDEDTSIEEKNKALRSIIEKVIFDREKSSFDFYYHL